MTFDLKYLLLNTREKGMNKLGRLLGCMCLGLMGCELSQATHIVVNSTQTVNPFADDGLCTLPEAIQSSNINQESGALPGECPAGQTHPVVDDITFSIDLLPAVFVLESSLTILESVNILGQHKELVTISAIGFDRIMNINGLPGQQISLKDLSIVGGYAPIGTPPISVGGGILASLNSAALHIERVRFEGNNAEYAGGALAIGYGGTQNNETTILQTEFINNSSIGSVTQINDNHGGGGAVFIGGFQTVNISQSTFAGNTANSTAAPQPTGDGMGGAIWMLSSNASATSSLEIENSTFDDNEAYGVGGAISIGGPGFPSDQSIVNIKHSTIINNTADANQTDTGNAAGGIFGSTAAPINVFNNVIARNRDLSSSSRPNLMGQFNTFGHNYINGNQGISAMFPLGSPNINDDFVVPSNGIPDLAPLADNGGPTLTRAIETGSPLIDQGKCGNADSDQRGFFNATEMIRADDDPFVMDFIDGCDIGAFESGTVSQNIPPVVGQESYTMLEDSVLVVIDVDGNLTPGDDNDNGLLANDFDTDSLWVITAGEFSMQSGNMNDPGIINLNADGLFSYTPAADEHGFAFDQFTLSDRFNHETMIFGIDVLPVNDAPEFTVAGATVFGFGNLISMINYEDWATEISTGPDNESAQTWFFDLIYLQGDDSFFSAVPSIDQAGTLSFEVSDTADGVVEMMVYLSDDGGTDNGGIDTSAGVMITIGRTISDVIFSDSFEPQDAS